MAIFKTLIKTTLTRNTYKSSTRNFLNKSLSSYPHPSISRSRFSLAKFLSPFNAPLFLSSPPWKLSQSTTPFHLDDVFLKKVEAFNLFRTRSVPIELGFAPISPCRDLSWNRSDSKDLINGGGEIVSFSDSLVNLPNLVSIGRLLSGPVLGWMIIEGWYFPAFVGLSVSGATDWLDGYIARKMNINSVIGSYLDPLADKVLIGCVALAMVHDNLLHPGLVGLVVMRDVLLVGGAVYKRGSDLNWQWKTWYDFFNLNGTSPHKIKPLFISKVNTVFQLALVAAALLQPDFGTEETLSYITYLSWLVASTTVASTGAYGVQHLRKRALSNIGNHARK